MATGQFPALLTTVSLAHGLSLKLLHAPPTPAEAMFWGALPVRGFNGLMSRFHNPRTKLDKVRQS
jgi:hypothetical protein